MTDDTPEPSRLSDLIFSVDTDRMIEIVARLAALVMDDRGITAEELFEWLSDDESDCWRE